MHKASLNRSKSNKVNDYQNIVMLVGIASLAVFLIAINLISTLSNI